MKLRNRFMKAAVCAALILAIIPGCSSDEEGDASTSASATEKAATESSAVVTTPQVDESKIKEIYKLSEKDSALVADEKTSVPITYAGFGSKVFSTPALTDDNAVITITPLYSHSGAHDYLHNNALSFDLGEGDGSFTSAMESYSDEFFKDKALLVISFLDKEGGSGYSVTGAWDDHVSGEGFEMDRLILGVKRSDGNVTAGHIIVEIDQNFLAIWDTFGMELYR